MTPRSRNRWLEGYREHFQHAFAKRPRRQEIESNVDAPDIDVISRVDTPKIGHKKQADRLEGKGKEAIVIPTIIITNEEGHQVLVKKPGKPRETSPRPQKLLRRTKDILNTSVLRRERELEDDTDYVKLLREKKAVSASETNSRKDAFDLRAWFTKQKREDGCSSGSTITKQTSDQLENDQDEDAARSLSETDDKSVLRAYLETLEEQERRDGYSPASINTKKTYDQLDHGKNEHTAGPLSEDGLKDISSGASVLGIDAPFRSSSADKPMDDGARHDEQEGHKVNNGQIEESNPMTKHRVMFLLNSSYNVSSTGP